MLCEVASTVTVATLIQAEAEPSKQNKVTRFEPELGQPGVYAYRKQSSSKGKAKEAAPPRIVEIHSEDDSAAEPTRFTNEFPPVVPQPPDSDTDRAGRAPLRQTIADPRSARRNGQRSAATAQERTHIHYDIADL
jgi:hypothetical protein